MRSTIYPLEISQVNSFNFSKNKHLKINYFLHSVVTKILFCLKV